MSRHCTGLDLCISSRLYTVSVHQSKPRNHEINQQATGLLLVVVLLPISCGPSLCTGLL